MATTAGWSRAECRRRRRLGRLTHEIPSCGEALWDGRIGTALADDLAAVRAHPRVGHEFTVDIAERVIERAQGIRYVDIAQVVKNWVSLMDVDGTRRTAEHTHEGRDASMSLFGGGFSLQARGAVETGTELDKILRRYTDAEFAADWEACVAEHGDRACVALMARTPAQRRADALTAIFRRAVTAPPGSKAPEPVLDVKIDEHTFMAHLTARLTGSRVERNAKEVLEFGICETLDGHPVSPDVAVQIALQGWVRRIVYDSGSTVIDMGRRRRLFTGAARTAVQTQLTHCVWPGCHQPTTRCEIDHRKPWNQHGVTAPANGDPCCRTHNRFKTHGYTVTRDPNGHWHTYRPDGTEIT